MLRPYFVGSFPSADVPLHPPLPEIALLGRSNVGKSSLLNALAGRRIAKISATPGKTRAMNVFEMPARRPVGAQHAAPLHHAYYILDLPGYGYAKVSHAERGALRRLVIAALDRPRLAGVLWLLDVRREPSDEDCGMQDLFAARSTRVLAAVTKSDKLPRGQRPAREQAIRATLGLEGDQIVLTSARSQEGVAELREAVAGLVREAMA